MNKPLLLLATALTLAACGEKRTDTATTTTTTDTTAGSTVGATATENGVNAETAAADIGQSGPVNAVQDAVGGVVGQVAAAAANGRDDYVKNAALSDMYEIRSSELALNRASNPAVKKFAQSMIDAHKAMTAELKKLASAGSPALTPPTALDARRQGFIDNLQAAKGAEFDKAYVGQQTAAHEEALTLHKSYVDDGEDAGLKTFATKTAPKVEMHLKMLNDMKTATPALS